MTLFRALTGMYCRNLQGHLGFESSLPKEEATQATLTLITLLSQQLPLSGSLSGAIRECAAGICYLLGHLGFESSLFKDETVQAQPCSLKLLLQQALL